MLGKRAKRQDGLHCQPEITKQKSAQTAAAPTKTTGYRVTAKQQFEDLVQAPPRAGRLYEQDRARRIKRSGCSICIDGRPIIKRTKRSLDCVRCTYLQPTESVINPFAPQPLPTSPVGIPPLHLRVKRAGCLPHPQCTFAPRVRRNLESQYCEPCRGGYYGRKKREAEIEKCHRRDKRATTPDCEVDEFLVTRMKRQTYNPKGILDIVKVLSKTMTGEAPGPGGCLKFPACVLAQTRRRKRHAEHMEEYHKRLALHKQAYEENLMQHTRRKRQFFAPDANAACMPCPAWVTLALASRKKRSSNSSIQQEEPRMTLSEAIADIRSKGGYKTGFEDDNETPRRKQGSCDQTDDCLNDIEYAIFKKVYHNTRVKRESFKKRKCEHCGSGFYGIRLKRSFGAPRMKRNLSPTINASEQSCLAFPQCRHRVKRHLWEDCNVCTSNISKKRKKRHADTPQCYPCPGTKP